MVLPDDVPELTSDSDSHQGGSTRKIIFDEETNVDMLHALPQTLRTITSAAPIEPLSVADVSATSALEKPTAMGLEKRVSQIRSAVDRSKDHHNLQISIAAPNSQTDCAVG